MSLSRARRAELHETMIVQIRQFIAASILFNQRVAEQTGLGLTDMQCVGVLEMLGPTTPGTLAEWTRLSSGGVTVMLDRLEKGDLPLEESLSLIEKGVSLSDHCRTELDAAEGKVQILVKQRDGSQKLEAFSESS